MKSTETKNAVMKAIRAEERSKYDDHYFRSEYWKEDLPGVSGNRGLSYDDIYHNARFSFLSNMLISRFEFETILDAGCGTGILVSELNREGKIAYGFDFSASAAKCYRQRVKDRESRFLMALISALPFEDSAFDLVFCSDVLEHLPFFDIEGAVREISRVSRRYVIATINLDNPYYYHPTILSRKNWESIFVSCNLTRLPELEAQVSHDICSRYEEYDFFVFEKTA